jgi:hypothetical protein
MPLINFNLNQQTDARLASVELLGVAAPVAIPRVVDRDGAYLIGSGSDLDIAFYPGYSNVFRLKLLELAPSGASSVVDLSAVTRVVVRAADIEIDSDGVTGDVLRWNALPGCIDIAIGSAVLTHEAGSWPVLVEYYTGDSDRPRVLLHPAVDRGVRLVFPSL